MTKPIFFTLFLTLFCALPLMSMDKRPLPTKSIHAKPVERNEPVICELPVFDDPVSRSKRKTGEIIYKQGLLRLNTQDKSYEIICVVNDLGKADCRLLISSPLKIFPLEQEWYDIIKKIYAAQQAKIRERLPTISSERNAGPRILTAAPSTKMLPIIQTKAFSQGSVTDGARPSTGGACLTSSSNKYLLAK